jgi:hypothetical protein
MLLYIDRGFYGFLGLCKNVLFLMQCSGLSYHHWSSFFLIYLSVPGLKGKFGLVLRVVSLSH